MPKYNRRRFLKASAAFAVAGSIGRTAPPSLGFWPATVSANLRPFEMLVLGDSVMWGQGLKEEMKSYSLVQDWISARLSGRAINKPNVKAHSGAKLWANVPCPQAEVEVNIDTPTVPAQLEIAV